ncbi:hypothetical protein BHE74_00018453 [Ensete ventricosum]|nr:hypothetical protein BHE74_00018453 [Ensete ventricosum]
MGPNYASRLVKSLSYALDQSYARVTPRGQSYARVNLAVSPMPKLHLATSSMPKSAISNRTTRYGWYIPVLPLTSMRTAHYHVVPLIGAVSAPLPPENDQ